MNEFKWKQHTNHNTLSASLSGNKIATWIFSCKNYTQVWIVKTTQTSMKKVLIVKLNIFLRNTYIMLNNKPTYRTGNEMFSFWFFFFLFSIMKASTKWIIDKMSCLYSVFCCVKKFHTKSFRVWNYRQDYYSQQTHNSFAFFT